MKYATRVLLAALSVTVGLGVLSVSVASQGRGRGPVRISADSRNQLRDWDHQVVRLERAGELRTRKTEPDTMIAGRRHERLDQYYKGVPVFGADVVRQVKDGETLSLFGAVYPGIDIDVTPAISPDAAIAVFERETGHAVSPGVEPQLMVLPKDNGIYVLAYRMSQFTGSELPVLFINAGTGIVELRYDNLKTASVVGRGRGVLADEKKVSASTSAGGYSAQDELRPPDLVTFDMRGNLTRVKQVLLGAPLYPSDIAFDSDNDWTDGATVDAHSYLGWTYDYWFKRFGRKGMDDRNGGIYAIVHPVSRAETLWLGASDFSMFAANAFWCGGCGQYGRGIMVFGEGIPAGYFIKASGQSWNYLAGALDVVAHELGHGLTDASSGLIYRGESGALNETFSDVIATGAEFYYQAVGSGALRADYLMAEDVVTPSTPGSRSGIRSLADPEAFQNPDHYSKRYLGTGDNGGVHTNGLIGGHAFYLAVEGGTNRTSGLSVQGVGAANRDQVEKIFYRAFAYYLTSSATFSTARAATIRAAQELYGSGSGAERAITQAWSAVGVF